MLEGLVLHRLASYPPPRKKTRSTPAEEAGAPKNWRAILASAGHLAALSFHHASRSRFMSSYGDCALCVGTVRADYDDA